MTQYTPLEQPSPTMSRQRVITLGLPVPTADSGRGFILTPEAVAMLTDRGIEVRLEAGAGASIHYDDGRYAACGARITDRRTALASDIVLHPAPLSAVDAGMLRRGALLLTMLNLHAQQQRTVSILLERHVVTLALDLTRDGASHRPFADAISGIDGRAAVILSSALLADPAGTKGILLGGVPGVIPCEVCILGSGMSAISAARAAMGMGAIVRMFDDDVYSLSSAAAAVGPGMITSALHPRVLGSALRTADVVIATPTSLPTVIDNSAVSAMKTGVLAFDLSDGGKRVFGNMKYVDLASDTAHTAPNNAQVRVCYTNPGSRVRRTLAMAMSNAFLAMMRDILTCDGLTDAIKLNRGMQDAVCTFMGRLTNQDLARRFNTRYVNVTLLVQFS